MGMASWPCPHSLVAPDIQHHNARQVSSKDELHAHMESIIAVNIKGFPKQYAHHTAPPLNVAPTQAFAPPLALTLLCWVPFIIVLGGLLAPHKWHLGTIFRTIPLDGTNGVQGPFACMFR